MTSHSTTFSWTCQNELEAYRFHTQELNLEHTSVSSTRTSRIFEILRTFRTLDTMATLVVTPSSIMDERRWNLESFSWNGQLDLLSLAYVETSPKVAVFGRLSDATVVLCTTEIPIFKLMIMSPAIDDSVKWSGLLPSEISDVVIDVESIDALALITGIIINPEYHPGPKSIVCVRRIEEIHNQPFSTYLQVAKLAQTLVMRPIWEDMVNRLCHILPRSGVVVLLHPPASRQFGAQSRYAANTGRYAPSSHPSSLPESKQPRGRWPYHFDEEQLPYYFDE